MSKPGSVWSSLRPALPRGIASVICSVVAGIAAVVPLWCIVELVRATETGWIVLALAAWFVQALASAAAAWLAHSAEAQFEARVRRRLAAHLSRLPATTLTRIPAEEKRRLLDDDVAALHHLVAHLPGEIAVFLVVPLCSLLGLVAGAGPVGLLALLPAVGAGAFYLVVIPRRSRAHAAERASAVRRITTAVDDYARGIEIVRVFGAERGAAHDYEAATVDFTHGMLSWVRRVAGPAALAVALLQPVTTLALAFFAGFRLDAAGLAAVMLFSLALAAPVLRLGHGLDYVAAGRAAATRLDAFLALTPLRSGTQRLPEQAELTLEARGAGLRIGGPPVLREVDMRCAPGTVTAIVGESGAGKSTLLRLLGRTLDPDEGDILLNGVPFSALVLDDFARCVFTVPQNPGVLPRTVAENLRIVDPAASADDLLAVLAAAVLSVSLDTPAALLSGGEQQRLAVARALLSSAPVLLLDEPTSALDEGTALRVMARLRSLARQERRTIVLVTHSEEIAAFADRTLRVSSGTLLSAGEARP